MRLFIAALLPENINEQISGYVNSLKQDIDGVRWEKPEKLHLTLKFLGNVEDEQARRMSAALEQLAETYSPFVLNISEFGGFPRLKNPRVLYVGLSENENLSTFHSELDLTLSKFGFEKEERKFTPHITIGRVKQKISVKQAPDITKTAFEITQIGIIKSELRSSGSIYTPLKLFKLDK